MIIKPLYIRWNSVSNDDLLRPPIDPHERNYSTSSQFLVPNLGNSNNLMVVNTVGSTYPLD